MEAPERRAGYTARGPQTSAKELHGAGNSFRAGGHPSGISSATGQRRILPLQDHFLLGAL
jgi:hypothetical protein